MTENRKPRYPIATLKAAFADPTALNWTFAARQGAVALGLGAGGVIDVVQSLSLGDLDKSMTSYVNPRTWQDVYKPRINGRVLYVKFTLDARKELLLISFKEA